MKDLMLDEDDPNAFYELIYADNEVKSMIKAKWPRAVFTDASDAIHLERFEVKITNLSADDFYPVAIIQGWSRSCFAFELSMRIPEKQDDVIRWIEAAGITFPQKTN